MEKEIKINPVFSGELVLKQAREFFERENFIQFEDFFDDGFNIEDSKFQKSISNQEFISKYCPMKFKFKELNTQKLFNFETLKFLEYFKSEYFLEFIESICELELELLEVKVREYSVSDFKLIYDDPKEKIDRIDVFFDLSNNFEVNEGGTLTYVSKEEEIFYLDPKFNTLTILFKPANVTNYVKYINNFAKKKKILRFEMKFLII